MTARTTTLKGSDAGRYYVEDELGYYLDRGEPPGRWQGSAPARRGLSGDVDEDDFLALMAGLDPSSGQLLGSAHGEDTVRGYDVTCSAPKGVSVLLAVGDEDTRRAVLDAHDTAVGAVVDWIERHAHCRYRVDGKVRVVDAEGILAAVFRQHTSRALDPQLHSHIVIPNRVPSPDGRWLALDARTIKVDQQTLSRLYHAGLRSELTRRLGLRWHEPENGIAEVAGVPEDVLWEFSQRTVAIDQRIEDELDRFHETFDRAPTPRERWRLERDAVHDTRPQKEDTDPVSLEAEWRERLDGLGVDAHDLMTNVTGLAQGLDRIDALRRAGIAQAGLAALGEMQSTWRHAEVVRELAAAVPTRVAVPAEDLARWLDDLADQVIAARCVDLSRPAPPGTPVRRDGRPVTEAATDRLLTTPEILAQEERLQALAERRLAAGGNDHLVERTEDLTPAQQHLATAVAGERALVLAVGPAGTGKTSALRPAVEQLRREGRAVFGVAPSATAAEVLAVDTGVEADTIDKLLVEHRLDRPPDHRYDLPAGTTVVCDEAAMVSTQRLAELFELAEQRAWRLVLVGDPMQFSAVGRSGMFGHLVGSFDAIELGRVHRFEHRWEAEASLRLRRGDTTVVEEYEREGRLHGGTHRRMRAAAVDAWWDAIGRGESASLTATTNASVIDLNHEAQRRRLEAGQLDPQSRNLTVGPYRLHPGDWVTTRHNDRDLVTDRLLMVKNRDRWTVEAVHRDGSLTVEGRSGRVRLPAAYVAQHVELAYAQTSHASQGRTVDRSFLYLDGPTGAAGIYVPMTRGRQSNEAFVVLQGEETPADVVAEALTRIWIDRPAIAVRAEMQRGRHDDGDDKPVLSRPLPGREVRRLLERAADLDRAISGASVGLDIAERGRAQLADQRAATERSLAEGEARLAEARAVLERFDKPLVRRRHLVEVEGARRLVGWLPGSIERDRADLAELADRIAAAEERVRQESARCDEVPALEAERREVERRLDGDAVARASDLLTEATFDRVGPRPRDAAAAALWDEAAGRLAQHQAAWEVSEGAGRRPQPFGDDAYALSHRAAVATAERLDRALGRQPEIEPPHRSLGLSL